MMSECNLITQYDREFVSVVQYSKSWEAIVLLCDNKRGIVSLKFKKYTPSSITHKTSYSYIIDGRRSPLGKSNKEESYHTIIIIQVPQR
jgi:hypothetical protein